ncbi:MAG TPA: rRNA maturation RNase YbeY [Dehalococcoidia bacterium]|nr:rRNA maturation RNase YbeY [Dehalococcoidia bacterium]
MPDYRLSIHIEDPFIGLVDEQWLKHVVETTLVIAGVRSPVAISLVIAGDETVRNLNRTYRGVDSTTDVLAFALSGQVGDEYGHFIVPPDEPAQLGEVIISYRQAEKQAGEQRHSLNRELALLVAHGVLHLMGYDHEEPEGEQSMKAMESRVLDAIEKE